MMRMMVGFMGREAFRSISSRVIPMIDKSTMARSNWFHLGTHTHMFSISLRIKAACMFVSLYSCESSNTSL